MYICICNAIKESDLRDAACAHPGTAEQLYEMLGSTPQCRQCLEDAEAIVAEMRAIAPADMPLLH